MTGGGVGMVKRLIGRGTREESRVSGARATVVQYEH